MSDETIRHRIALALDTIAESLHHRVTEALVEKLPMIGVPPHAEQPGVLHRENMASTVWRFHELVKAGATIDPRLVAAEYGWAGRKLASMGAAWEHQAVLFDSYFAEALAMHDWTPEERDVLTQIEHELREVALQAYTSTSASGV